nr:immunoglobulin light chain junction region [Macaca mulatta]MOW04089.1 immunoglobulin light chain junction region [Macaca mulatta]MOW04178.1 immunoglobulin light chain junction region [Macaca mulatta]MOW04182.1 immunoglobulin light chain junction region [Macaca mulatta]MOW04239.1 immunoglobulin light chain junction region [Macaca mulatta]
DYYCAMWHSSASGLF